ncbi:amidohydrolase [Dyadobacter chenhuakuii]|uniref:Amidohydrolase n=1 Tax=Dyadobacter chenhuakuii TaxID=2909339 RepID=A0A9X1Q923_9BACT|nr:amidohydrolase [Dyadobacter chenhuakuii]MCF2496739.1 amidohydrolase [Dyadobacter chenhuakuii]
MMFLRSFAICLLGAVSHALGQRADLILINANIHTMAESGQVFQSLAITSNKISALGSNAQVMKTKSKKTRIIDAGGKTIVPGLFDSHLHVIRGGRFYNAELRWDGVKTLKRALGMLGEQAKRTPKGQWVRVVGGWNEYQFEEKRLPTLDEINEVTGDVPTFILYLYGKAWLNKAAITALDINANTPNPQAGLIEKDENGDPTGLLVAEPNAFILYSTLAKLPELSGEEKINSTIQFMTELNRLGVTAVMDAGGGFQNFPDDYVITDSLYKQGKLTVRLPYFLFAQKKGTELADYSRWIGMVDVGHIHSNDESEEDYRVAGGGENLLAEAADFENFLLPRPELPPTMQPNLVPIIELLAKNKWPFRFHATYDESISKVLDVIEKVSKQTPLATPWFFDHAETISEQNIRRIKALGGGIAIQHRMAYQGELFMKRYGKAAASAAPPIKKMLEIGLPVGLGTDGTRVASYNPWIALQWLITGKTIGNTQVMKTENTLDRNTALRLLTSGGYTLLKDKTKGIIELGSVADLAVLSNDYFSVPDEEIHAITSDMTVLDGKIVWADKEFKTLGPARLPVIPDWSPVKYYGGYQTK